MEIQEPGWELCSMVVYHLQLNKAKTKVAFQRSKEPLQVNSVDVTIVEVVRTCRYLRL